MSGPVGNPEWYSIQCPKSINQIPGFIPVDFCLVIIFVHTTQHQIVYFPESEWKWVVCDPNFIYFHSQDAFRETQYKSLAPPNTDSLWKIENSLVSNIYSTPILFFSKWVWIRTRVRHFCISEFAPKMDELEFSHLRLKLPCGPSYFKVAKSCSYSWMHNIILIFLSSPVPKPLVPNPKPRGLGLTLKSLGYHRHRLLHHRHRLPHHRHRL